MGKIFEGDRNAGGKRFAIAAGRFNEFIVNPLVTGAQSTLDAAGGTVDVAWAPGAVELPLVAQALAKSGRYDAVVVIGCVIRGGTPHFEYVSGMAANGVLRGSMETGVPISFGVLTVDTIEQAIQRAGTKLGNKGVEAAEAAIEMVTLLPKIQAG